MVTQQEDQRHDGGPRPAAAPQGVRTGRELGFGIGVFTVALTLLLVRFLVPRPVSAADNGDGARVLCGLGINWAVPHDDFARLSFTEPVGVCDSDYVLSQIWFAKAGRIIGDVLGLDSTVNMIVVGILGSTVAAAGVAVIALGLPFGWKVRVGAAAGVLLLLADSAFFGYFSSILGEGPAFLGLTLMSGGMLLLARRGWWRWLGVAVTLFGAMIGVNAKVQTLMILPVLLLALVFLRPGGVRGMTRWLPVGVLGLAVIAGTLFVQPFGKTMPGSDTREINMFNTMFMSIVDGKHDTKADLADLGLPESWEKYAANGWWHANPARFDPEYDRYRDRVSRRNVVTYLVKHPARTTQILDRAATDLLTARPDYLASFPKESGFPPRTLEYRVPILSGATAFLAPLGLWVLIPVWLLVAVAGIRAWRPRVGRRELGVVLLFLLTIGVGQFLLGALGDGIENIKHQSVALFCTLLASVLAVVSLFARARRQADAEETSTR